MCLPAVAHCPTPCRFLSQQSFHCVPPTQNLQQGGQEGLLDESLPGDVPHPEGHNVVYSSCLSPKVWGGGQLLQGPHAAPMTLFLPSSSLSFSVSLLVLLGGCWAGSPTGMLWGNYGTRDIAGCCSLGMQGGGCRWMSVCPAPELTLSCIFRDCSMPLCRHS